ncbi:unnamed protein product [Linum trigynum]|uniref:Uncharacterized protein n=1 Tax=Linum trigynum TaxID=586398 RepID=A0AAV2FT43_9ROSI
MGFEMHDGAYVRAYNPHVVDDDDDDDDIATEFISTTTLQHIWDRMDDMYNCMGKISTQITDLYDYIGQMTTQMSALQVTVTEMREKFLSFSGRYMHPTTSDYHDTSTINEENADK